MKRIIFASIGLIWMGCSHAVTECSTSILRIYTGDEGVVWMVFNDSLTAYVTAADPDAKNILASGLAALMGDKIVTIRFMADNVPCNHTAGVRSDVTGMWLHK
jgi:3'-phosphoadenosine 5'-phosphosulfate (PAPS) 3'-phosphatase